MLPFSSLSRFFPVGGALVLAALLFSLQAVPPQNAHAQADAPFVFTVLGPDGAVARVITTQANCPEIRINGNTTAMQVRAGPDEAFPITVCDAALPQDTREASILDHQLKLPKPAPERVVVLGDTGCRLKDEHVQGCNDPAQWPLAPLAQSAAATAPDLVIHVGDYHYRESPCIVDKADCAGSPYGDNWASWNADLFTPARPLLQAAPWVVVEGNHEDCARAGIGFYRMLDPRPMPASCPEYTDPYAINYMNPRLIVVDNSAVDDYNIIPAQVAEFKRQFDLVNGMAQGTSWLLMHDPMYVFGHAGEKEGKETLFQDQPTLQQASNNTFPASVQMFISGHIHLFEVLSFGEGRPPQLVVGNSGTLLDPPVTTPLTGLEIAGRQVGYGTMIDKFGFALLERAGDKWAIAVKNVSGGDLDKCVLGGGMLLCGQAALPVGGIELSNQWAVVAGLFGSAIVFFGIALAVRGAIRYRRQNPVW
jgi:hypothetical protein